jgi:hypothetical protein
VGELNLPQSIDTQGKPCISTNWRKTKTIPPPPKINETLYPGKPLHTEIASFSSIFSRGPVLINIPQLCTVLYHHNVLTKYLLFKLFH